MKPIYISVDCEFTDGNLKHGQLMQLGMFNIETESTWSAVIPINTDAKVNDWVRQNLPHLVSAALQTRIFGGRAETYAIEAFNWVRQQQVHAYFSAQDIDGGGEGEVKDPAKIVEDFPAVFVAYCGGYDFGFTTKLFNAAELENPFHYEMVDISALALGLLPDLEWGFSAEDLEKALDLGPNEQKHDALADAKHQAEVFRRLTALRDSRRKSR